MRSTLIRFLAVTKARVVGCALFCSLLFTSVLASQTASYTFVGKDCGSSSTQMLEVLGTPKLGSKFEMVISGSFTVSTTAWTLNYLFTGFSNKHFGHLKLPFDIAPLSQQYHKFCGILRSDVHLVFLAPNLIPRVKVPFTVPRDRSLLGLSVFHQAFRILGLYDMRTTTWTYYYDISRGGHGIIGT